MCKENVQITYEALKKYSIFIFKIWIFVGKFLAFSCFPFLRLDEDIITICTIYNCQSRPGARSKKVSSPISKIFFLKSEINLSFHSDLRVWVVQPVWGLTSIFCIVYLYSVQYIHILQDSNAI